MLPAVFADSNLLITSAAHDTTTQLSLLCQVDLLRWFIVFYAYWEDRQVLMCVSDALEFLVYVSHISSTNSIHFRMNRVRRTIHAVVRFTHERRPAYLESVESCELHC